MSKLRKPARRCPVPMCGNAARAGHLMCRSCWASVPSADRTIVNRAWRAVRQATADRSPLLRPIITAYRSASDAAVAAAERARP